MLMCYTLGVAPLGPFEQMEQIFKLLGAEQEEEQLFQVIYLLVLKSQSRLAFSLGCLGCEVSIRPVLQLLISRWIFILQDILYHAYQRAHMIQPNKKMTYF